MTDYPNMSDEQRQALPRSRRPGAPAFVPPHSDLQQQGYVVADGDADRLQAAAISKIVKATRSAHELSLREFAAALSDSLGGISHTTVKNWEDGLETPRPLTLLPIMLQFDDWRRDLAFDILSVLNPGLYKPATQIGREVQS